VHPDSAGRRGGTGRRGRRGGTGRTGLGEAPRGAGQNREAAGNRITEFAQLDEN